MPSDEPASAAHGPGRDGADVGGRRNTRSRSRASGCGCSPGLLRRNFGSQTRKRCQFMLMQTTITARARNLGREARAPRTSARAGPSSLTLPWPGRFGVRQDRAEVSRSDGLIDENQRTTQAVPPAPITRNGSRQAEGSVASSRTAWGAMIAPSAVPLWSRLFPRARSRGAMSTWIVFRPHGSGRPRRARGRSGRSSNSW